MDVSGWIFFWGFLLPSGREVKVIGSKSISRGYADKCVIILIVPLEVHRRGKPWFETSKNKTNALINNHINDKYIVAPFWYHSLIFACNTHAQAKKNMILTVCHMLWCDTRSSYTYNITGSGRSYFPELHVAFFTEQSL